VEERVCRLKSWSGEGGRMVLTRILIAKRMKKTRTEIL
jgi:hypothetical protein